MQLGSNAVCVCVWFVQDGQGEGGDAGSVKSNGSLSFEFRVDSPSASAVYVGGATVAEWVTAMVPSHLLLLDLLDLTSDRPVAVAEAASYPAPTRRHEAVAEVVAASEHSTRAWEAAGAALATTVAEHRPSRALAQAHPHGGARAGPAATTVDAWLHQRK